MLYPLEPGFMCGTTVLDKDGISAAMVMAEMVTQLAKQSITVKQQLDNIYAKYKSAFFIVIISRLN